MLSNRVIRKDLGYEIEGPSTDLLDHEVVENVTSSLSLD